MFLLLLLASVPAWGRHVPDEVIVRFVPGTGATAARRTIDELGARERGELAGLGFKCLKLPPGLSPEAAIARLERNPNILTAGFNPLVHPVTMPNDPLVGSQWHLAKIQATTAWTNDVGGHQGSAAVVIAIIDSGIDPAHPDLAPKLVAGYNAINPAAPPSDEASCGHGTLVASIAAAATGNGLGGAGVAWLPRLMPVKAIAYEPSLGECVGNSFDIDQGVLWAASHGAKVINMSLGGDERSDAEAATMQSAFQSGCLLVAAAGNDGASTPSYPAAYPFVVGVAATDSNDQRASFSNFGFFVDLAAPGVAMVTSNAAGVPPAYAPTYTYDGTSFSAPVVAGVAAVLLGQDPGRSNDDLIRILEQTADHLGAGVPGTRNDQYGFGRVNLYRALTGAATPAPKLEDNGYAYPNPFSPTQDRYLTFVIKAPGGQAVTVRIFDAVGNPVWSKALTSQETANTDLYYNSPMRWDGRDSRGREMTNGVYKAVITVGTSRTIKNIVVAR